MKRLLIYVSGCVQGVGFRPFVFRLARQHRLAGNVKNTNAGVIIDVQGEDEDLAQFQKELVLAKPEKAVVSDIKFIETKLHEVEHFKITESELQSDAALPLLPDTAICPSCLEELYDPSNRRYRYPFLHCVHCGPRFSLFLTTPFDRASTTMKNFTMCNECRREYEDPDDRRFYSQTNCCPACGPKLELLDRQGQTIAQGNDAWMAAVEVLREGKIAAVKSTGGYQLLVDATQNSAVERLRALKKRPSKPFALLADMTWAGRIAEIEPVSEKVLRSSAAPIVFLNRKKNPWIASGVTRQSPYYGVMLPHNGLQHLMLGAIGKPLVATSGNVSGHPLCIAEQEALDQLSGIADVFLVHNRDISHRVDDSVVHIIADLPMMIRRARGYVPSAVTVSEKFARPVLGVGGHLKNTFALAKEGQIYLSQHIGDLDSLETCRAYDASVEKWKALLGISDLDGIGDKHPEYYTSQYLSGRSISHDEIQHHVAHAMAGMIDNQLTPPFLSIVWDGTGMGEDDTIWGSEAFIVGHGHVRRFASLFPFPLPGGEKAVREPRRSLLGAWHAMQGENIPPFFSKEECDVMLRMIARKINTPLCSSMGRLFDAVSAALGLCTISDFEGQAALALESIARETENPTIHYSIPLIEEKEMLRMDWRSMFRQMFKDKNSGHSAAEIGSAFHDALAECIVTLAHSAKLQNVLLTGGCMQNKLLVEKAIAKLKAAGFTPYWHHRIPPNDGGIAVGQIIAASWRNHHVPCITGKDSGHPP